MTTQTIRTEALKLPPADRRDLAHELIESLDDDEVEEDELELSPELIAKLDQISKEIDEHPELLVSLDEVEKELDAEFRK